MKGTHSSQNVIGRAFRSCSRPEHGAVPTLVIPELGSEVAVVRKRQSQIWAPASRSTSSLFPAPQAAQVSERRGAASDRELRGKYSALRL